MLNLQFESEMGSKGDGLCEHIHICSVLNELHIYIQNDDDPQK